MKASFAELQKFVPLMAISKWKKKTTLQQQLHSSSVKVWLKTRLVITPAYN